MIADDITWYLTSLTAFSEKKPSTIAAYAADLQKLAVFADDTGVEHAEEMDETFLQDFLLNLKNSGASKSGIRRAVACLHGFFASLVAEGKLSRDPSENLSGTQDAKDAAEKENAMKTRLLQRQVRRDREHDDPDERQGSLVW